MPVPATTLTYTLTDDAGNPIQGRVVMTLVGFGNQIPRIGGTSVIANLVYSSDANTFGQGSITFYNNAQTTPAGTYFSIAVYPSLTSNAPTSVGDYRFLQAGTFDLSSITPINASTPFISPVVIGNPVLLNPTSTQVISTYGLEGPWFGSETVNLATSGTLRLAKSDTIDWRNNANTANLALGINSGNQLIFNGTIVGDGSNVINVKNFGAVGDGVTDDTAALQAAFNSCSTFLGLVYFPAGTYLISSPVTHGQNCTGYFGDSVDNSIVQATSSFNGTMIAASGLTADLVGFVIRDITLNGAGKTSTFTVNGINLASSGHDIVRLYMANVNANNFSGDVFTGSVVIVSTFINCEFGSVAGNGWKLINGGTSVSFISCYANGIALAGFDLTAYYYCTFINCACDSSGVSYYLHNCQTIGFYNCGGESLVYTNSSYPGTCFWGDNVFNCNWVGCYNILGNPGSGNAANMTLRLSSNSAKNTIIGLKGDYNNGGTLPTWGIVLDADTGQNTFINVDLNDNGINLGGAAGTHDIGANQNWFQEGMTITNPGGSANAFTVTDEIISEILTAVGPAGTSIISVAQTGDTNPRIILTNNDGLYYTSGSAGVDAQLSRYSPGVLTATGTLGGGIGVSAYGDNFSRISLQNDNGGFFFGVGSSPFDTTLGRSGGAGRIGIGKTGYGDHSGTLIASVVIPGMTLPVLGSPPGDVVCDASISNSFEVDLNQAVTLIVNNGSNGQTMTILWVQDSMGSRTVAFPSNVLGGTAPSATPNSRSCQSFIFSSNQGKWFATAAAVTGM